MSKRILVVEDELDLSDTVVRYAIAAGFQAEALASGTSALERLRTGRWDLVVLDLNLPDMDGLDVCQQLRLFSVVPVIITTARAEEMDRIIGLEVGADDYLCKPYSPRELVARMHALFRRMEEFKSCSSQTFLFDDAGYRVNWQDETIALTKIEYRIFRMLYRASGQVVSRDRLKLAAYDDHRVVSSRNMDSHVAKLRKKIRSVVHVDVIKPVYGAGYLYDGDST